MTNTNDERFNNDLHDLSKQFQTFDQICQDCQDFYQRLNAVAKNPYLKSNPVQEISTCLSGAKGKISLAETWLKDILKTLRKICLHSNTGNEAQFAQFLKPILISIKRCLNAIWSLDSMKKIFLEENVALYKNNFLDGDASRQNDRFIKETKQMFWFINELIKRTTIVSIESPTSVLRDSTSTNDKSTQRNLDNGRAKCRKAFRTQLKCLGLNETCIFLASKKVTQNIRPLVEALLVSEEDAVYCLDNGVHPSGKGDLTNNTSTMVFENNQGSVWTADFSNMRVKTVDRGEKGSKTKKVAQMLYRIFFAVKIGCIDFGNGNGPVELKTEAVSKPFTLASNPSQRKESLPYVCWARAFDLLDCEKGYVNVDTRKLPWPDFKESLNEILIQQFKSNSPGRPLQEFQLNYLGEMLFSNEPFLNSEVNSVTLDLLRTNCIPNSKVTTFWEWFYQTIDFIGNKKVAKYWEEEFFCGYISRKLTEQILRQCPEPAMLIRFSSGIGNLVFSIFLPNDGNIEHLQLEMKHCQDLSLYQCYVKLCQEFKCLKEIKYVCGGPEKFLTIEAFHDVKVNEKVEKTNEEDPVKIGYRSVNFVFQNVRVAEEDFKKLNRIGGNTSAVHGTINLYTNSPSSNRSSSMISNDSDESRTPNELSPFEQPSAAVFYSNQGSFISELTSEMESILSPASFQTCVLPQDSGSSSDSRQRFFTPLNMFVDENTFDQYDTLPTPVEETLLNGYSSTDGNLHEFSNQELAPYMMDTEDVSNGQRVYQQLI